MWSLSETEGWSKNETENESGFSSSDGEQLPLTEKKTSLQFSRHYDTPRKTTIILKKWIKLLALIIIYHLAK